MRRALLIFGLFSLLVGCDQVSKHAAVEHLQDAPHVLIDGVFELRYAENRDTAFSLFRGFAGGEPAPWVMGLLASIAIAALGIAMWRRRDEATHLERAAMLLILSGAVGNLVDRFSRGFVVDFLHLHHWPIFNVADVLVVIGIVLWLVATRREQRYARAP